MLYYKNNVSLQSDIVLFENYTKLNSVQKTLRFELKPIGQSLKNLQESGLLDKDLILAQNYPIMKKMVDTYHKNFIESCLGGYRQDWSELANAIDTNRRSNNDNSEKNRKEVERICKAASGGYGLRMLTDDFSMDGFKRFLMTASKEAIGLALNALPFGGVAKIAFSAIGNVISDM